LTLPTPVETPLPVEAPAKTESPPTVETPAPTETPPPSAVAAIPVEPAGERRGPSATFTASDFGTGPERPVRATRAPDSAPASSPATAMAVPGGITQTAIPRGGYQVRPSYPGRARRLGIEGTTTLRIFVAADGRVADVVVEESAGHPDLDHAAADAVRRWRFEPARRGTEAVGMWVLLPVEFRLR
jgi:protein TonB